jgi:hypothetical protein
VAAAAYPGAGIEGGVDEVAGTGEEHVQVPPPFGLRWRRRLRVRGSHLSRLPLEWTGEESVGVEGAAHKGGERGRTQGGTFGVDGQDS